MNFEYKIYYIHQNDKREFNRGAMKNIGFMVIKDKYPNDYQNITLVFNDVDTMPYSKNFLNFNPFILLFNLVIIFVKNRRF